MTGSTTTSTTASLCLTPVATYGHPALSRRGQTIRTEENMSNVSNANSRARNRPRTSIANVFIHHHATFV